MPPDEGVRSRHLPSVNCDDSKVEDNKAKANGDGGKGGRLLGLSTVNVVKLLVFIDMLSVAVMVPLLSSYFRDLNISAGLYGLMSSAYSFSQILGGLVFGALSDRVLSRKSVLLLSFLGSALSYGLVGMSSSLSMLLVGRVIVGLVKQTMTISTALISEHTTSETRSGELSQLTAAATFSFIVGPSCGSFLYQRSKILPPMVSSSLFLLNYIIALLLLPSKEVGAPAAPSSGDTVAPVRAGGISGGDGSGVGKGDGNNRE
ncbi:unnamed protein product, partial [Discosporangium mesarthrocarpum]